MFASLAAAALLVALAASPLPRAAAEDGRVVPRTLTIAGQAHRYAVWLPPGHDSRRAAPAIVFLHGAGESGGDGERPLRVGLGPALAARPERWPFVVVFPQKPRADEEWEEHEAMVLAIIERVQREFRLDPDRIALVGISQGGHGVWRIGARQAGRWSCLVPVCGYGRARTTASRVARMPVWAFHGLRDDVVDPRDTRAIVDALKAERTRQGLDPEGARLTLYPDANHNSWDAAFAEPELPAFLLAARRARIHR
jgi:predicted peptidase